MKNERPENPKIEPVYNLNGETFVVLHQIVADMREDADRYLKNKWNIPFKSLKHCTIKTNSDGTLTMIVHELHGGFRVRQEPVEVLQKRAQDTIKLLKSFEKELKREYKQRTKKTLNLSGGVTSCDYQLIATNGLYKFFAIKHCKINKTLDGQEYKDSLKGDF